MNPYHTLLCLLIPLLSFSQTYKKTLKSGKQWHIQEHIGMGASSSDYFTTICDTVINAKHYYQIHRVSNSNTSFSPILGFVREDTLAQKVYYLDTNAVQEELISDYTLTVGDSFNFTWYTPSFKLPVVNVDTMYINQAMRKVIHFPGAGQGPYLRFIEGVGVGFWGIYRNYDSFINNEFVSDVIENTGISCNNLPSYKIVDQQEARVYIFPNPVRQGISIKIEDTSYTLEQQIGIIYNALGQAVQRFEMQHQKDLSLTHLAMGVYFIQIGNFPAIKIIKTH